jgi:hypothetical protein
MTAIQMEFPYARIDACFFHFRYCKANKDISEKFLVSKCFEEDNQNFRKSINLCILRTYCSFSVAKVHFSFLSATIKGGIVL